MLFITRSNCFSLPLNVSLSSAGESSLPWTVVNAYSEGARGGYKTTQHNIHQTIYQCLQKLRFQFFLSSLSVGCIPAVVLVKRLCWDTMEQFSGEDPEECPCQIERLKDIAGVIRPLSNKLLLEFIEELKIQLHVHTILVSVFVLTCIAVIVLCTNVEMTDQIF